MTAITWNDLGKRFFEDGLDRGVLYPLSGPGVAWNGLVSIEETVSGGEQTPLYYDGIKYLDIISYEDFQANLTALAAPEQFGNCDGTRLLGAGLYVTQQPRQTFGLSYRTRIGNDAKGLKFGYKLHVVYNATASPSGRNSKTLTNTAEPETRSWTVDTVPVPGGITGIKPTAHLVIDSTKTDPAVMASIEGALYGNSGAAPQLVTQANIASIMGV